ncbi:phosphatidylserine decarboxylase family protein [Desulfuromonas acetoxidans]|uniref:Phosphatidylserine decarboxylase proenzyme n=1 Tax=Desulfuromonas acetoxidans (strain DSM 684 / 11070) TaxID=281689 RepID=Q1K338_DESA6|nr:phosphatidylserine decarboxylase family protein [Desulfuromonas acetoxidans]EAT16693.1 Phosphatidylserine decarboxylase-related protein [Desulfuromonas acetoxidans DSM 684]MBF0644835.1 phosphatidylserine decarboxylase family protein [Desulfuromonas acetoxidans]NVD23632.1 phosphatidylserine decarboxylase family protein [Desulfuromonas acetoxidans]NVE15983.1 phosphatidylserine decarboxylase family protein [Desulfuromonas acetoxidans]
MRNQNQPIAVEGYPFVGLFAFVTLVVALLDWSLITVLCLAVTLFSVYFFRNPDRTVPQGEGLVVAPADGKVVFADIVREERYCKDEVLKISIFMSLLDVHVNRVPCSGKVVDQFYNKGQFFNASLDKASLENEQAGMLVETTSGRKVVVVQIAGLIARRIVTYPVIGDVLECGQRFGLIRFGSRLDVYLPKDTVSELRIGDVCVGGETVIGQLQ